jgi:hypothetical protein
MGKTYAPFKVWRGSSTAEIKAPPMSKREAVIIFHDARRFERQTRGFHESRYRPGKISRREGKLGRSALDVLHALLFDFRNDRTGRMDPCYASIAHKACVSIATAGRALRRLKEAGVINWVQRCVPGEGPEGGFLMRQISNLYGVLPSTGWRGFKRPPDPPKPDPASWGAAPPMSSADAKAAGGVDGLQTYLAYGTPLDRALARLRPPRSQ